MQDDQDRNFSASGGDRQPNISVNNFQLNNQEIKNSKNMMAKRSGIGGGNSGIGGGA